MTKAGLGRDNEKNEHPGNGGGHSCSHPRAANGPEGESQNAGGPEANLVYFQGAFQLEG